MKKIARTIAMILVMVMIVSSFSGCLSYHLAEAGLGSDPISGMLFIGALAIDIVTSPFQLIYLIVITAEDAARKARGKKYDEIDTFSQLIRSLPEEELASLMQTVDSLPEDELASLTQRFYSLSEADIEPFTRTVNSFSETEFAAMAAAFNNLPESEIVSAIKTVNSMPEESLIVMLNDLQHIEFCYEN